MAVKKKASRSKATKKPGGSSKADLQEKPHKNLRRGKAYVMALANRKEREAARSAGTSIKGIKALKRAMMPADPRVARAIESQAYRKARKVARKALEEKQIEALKRTMTPMVLR
jgi:hypothetical protein